MERDKAGQGHPSDVAHEPVGYLAGILERLKNLGPPPPRSSRTLSPGGETVGDEA